MDDSQPAYKMTGEEMISKGICPDCVSNLFYEEGCKKGYNCGFSAC